jgi:hypothetical protein
MAVGVGVEDAVMDNVKTQETKKNLFLSNHTFMGLLW